MIQTASKAESGEAAERREAMADKLLAGGWVGSAVVEAAFRTVPRHLFVPEGTPLEKAYDDRNAVCTKQNDSGTNISSVSAPWLQARMIAQAGIEPGMRVLEVGSGGYNAALLAEVTGEKGLVVTMDIDPEITGHASAYLEAAGYGDRVTVVTGDGEYGLPDLEPFDAIVVTAGAWDIPPAWRSQLADGGTLVLPLRMNTITRSLAFRRDGGHWASTSAEMCGFVPVQGIGARTERTFRIPGPGGHVELRFDQNPPEDPSALDGALGSGPVHAWSGTTIPGAASFADLHLWLASFLSGFCRVAAGDGTVLAAEGVGTRWFPFGCVRGDSFAYQASRRLDRPGEPVFEFGAGAYGPHAEDAAGAFLAQVREWDRHGRDIPGDAFAYWPAGTAIPERAASTGVFRKHHGTVTVSWPPAE